MSAPEPVTQPSPAAAIGNPTETLYSEIMGAYQYFNRTLFQSALPECLITLQRKKGKLASVSMDRFVRAEDGRIFTHEISVNPAYFARAKPREVLSSLVHEMCRIKINMTAAPDDRRSRGYHCKDWSKAMEAIGLMPSESGKPDGKKYGFKMHHYMMEGSLFDKASATLLEHGWKLTWLDRIAEEFDPSLMTDDDHPEEEEDLGEDESSGEEDPQVGDANAPESEVSQANGDEAPASGETEPPSLPSSSVPDAGAPPRPSPSLTRPNGVSHSSARPAARTASAAFNQRPVIHLDKAALIARPVTKSGNRYKYSCPTCNANAWGKSDLNLICGKCHKPMPGKPCADKPGAEE